VELGPYDLVDANRGPGNFFRLPPTGAGTAGGTRDLKGQRLSPEVLNDQVQGRDQMTVRRGRAQEEENVTGLG